MHGAHAQCLDALLKTAMSPRVPLALRLPACAGVLDGFFVHAAALLTDAAWWQMTELLDFLLLRCACELPVPPVAFHGGQPSVCTDRRKCMLGVMGYMHACALEHCEREAQAWAH